jgi:hypothetical protein
MRPIPISTCASRPPGKGRAAASPGLLGIDRGRQQSVCGRTGIFHEVWRLARKPGYAVELIAAGPWGGMLEAVATKLAAERALEAHGLPALTMLMEAVLLADLRDASNR